VGGICRIDLRWRACGRRASRAVTTDAEPKGEQAVEVMSKHSINSLAGKDWRTKIVGDPTLGQGGVVDCFVSVKQKRRVFLSNLEQKKLQN
jgi:hypothetical protein